MAQEFELGLVELDRPQSPIIPVPPRRAFVTLAAVLFVSGGVAIAWTRTSLSIAKAGGQSLATIFSDDEVALCGGFISKKPSFAVGVGYVHMVSGCGMFLNSSGEGRRLNSGLDRVRGHVIVFKSSSDGGKTWGNFQIISGRWEQNNPEDRRGYGFPAMVYDKRNGTLVVQFMEILSKEKFDQPGGAMLFQRTSTDQGKTWSRKRNLTSVLEPCRSPSGAPPRGMAGSRIQTASGRIIFGGYGYKAARCIWYSDDGGQTYTTSGLQQRYTNEWSMAAVGKYGLIMNSRKNREVGQNKYRLNSYSKDDGVTWSKPKPSKLRDAVNEKDHGCEASLLSIGKDLFFFSPAGPFGTPSARTKMRVRCSKDGGKTLASATYDITETREGGYSDMADISEIDGMEATPLLLGWGFGDYHKGGKSNLYVKSIGIGWCHHH